MMRNSFKIWLFSACVFALFAGNAPATSDDSAKGADEKDPLLEERAALYTEVRGMESRISEIRRRERELHGNYRDAIKDGKNLLDPANVDEDTGKIIVRVRELESELKTLREDLKVRLENHPQTVKARADMDKITSGIQELRRQREEIQKGKVEKVGRLRMIEQELRKRREAAAAEAKAKEESKTEKENSHD